MSLLQVCDLSVMVSDQQKLILNKVNLDVVAQSITAIVGGSGSGKSTTALAILRLLPPALRKTGGDILFNGERLGELSAEKMRHYRGKKIAMVFQEPLYAFNPLFTISNQIDEMLELHTKLTISQRQEKILYLLETVGIKDIKRVANSYPHQLSGGMRQRVMIAQAIAADPELLIADEPTSNLDVTLQAKIMELFLQLKQKLKLSMLLISHDLDMVSHLADKVYVMSEGKVVESGNPVVIMKTPTHDYTKKLIKAVM